jgi:hypothetical protein
MTEPDELAGMREALSYLERRWHEEAEAAKEWGLRRGGIERMATHRRDSVSFHAAWLELKQEIERRANVSRVHSEG